MPNHTNPNIVTDPLGYYGYIPTFWICVTFVTLFSLTTIVHLIQALFIKPRLYWLLPTTVLCGLGEVIGWSGRLWSSKNSIERDAFMIQICCTIIAPVFLTAAMYTILGLVISFLGSQYSRVQPKTYLKIFISADVFSLVVQAAGGGIASTANTDSSTKSGSNIMLAGIFLQLVGMIFYTIMAFEVILRFWFKKPFAGKTQATSSGASSIDEENLKAGKNMSADVLAVDPSAMSTRIQLMILALAITTVLVFIRTIYRSIELAGGWHGHIIRTQVFFNVLDATPIFLALFTLNVLSPSILLRVDDRKRSNV